MFFLIQPSGEMYVRSDCCYVETVLCVFPHSDYRLSAPKLEVCLRSCLLTSSTWLNPVSKVSALNGSEVLVSLAHTLCQLCMMHVALFYTEIVKT